MHVPVDFLLIILHHSKGNIDIYLTCINATFSVFCINKRKWKQKMYHFITTLHLTSTNCTRETCYLAAKNVFFSRSLRDCSVSWLKKWAPGLLVCTCWVRWAASSSGQQWSERSGWSSTRLDAACVSSPGPHLTVKQTRLWGSWALILVLTLTFGVRTEQDVSWKVHVSFSLRQTKLAITFKLTGHNSGCFHDF